LPLPVIDQESPASKRRPYLTLGMVAAAHSVTHMYVALMPIIYPLAMAQFGFNYAQLGFMVGLGNAFSSLLQGIYGFLTRRVLRRALLGLGNVFLAVSMFLTALSGGFFSFFCYNLFGRISLSPQHPVGNSLVSESFGKKLRGTAFAVNFAGGNAGTVLIPSLGTLAVATLGWRQSLSLFALLPLFTGFLCLFVIPEQKRLSGAPGEGKGGLRSAGRDFLAPLKDRNVFWVVVTATVAAGGRGIGVVMTYVPLYLQQGLQLNPASYATLYTLLMVGSVVGPLIVGRFSDVFGRKRLITVTYLLSLLSVVALMGAGKSMLPLTLALIFMGLVVYAQSSLIQALLADVTHKEMRDMAYSVFFTVSYLAGAIWTLVLGFCIDRFGFNGAFALMSISYLAGVLALLPVQVRE